MKPNTNARPSWQYFKAASAHYSAKVTLCSVSDLIRYAELHSIKAVMLLQGEHEAKDEAVSHFALLHNGTLIQQATEGYNSLEDYVSSAGEGFGSAADYYDAQRRGMKSYADYRIAREADIADLSALEVLKRGGYVSGYETWRMISNELPSIGAIGNPRALYEAAAQRGFPDYPSFEKAMKAGFTEYGDYQTATGQGYPDAAAYEDSVRRGFTSYLDYEFAREHKLRDAADAAQFVSMAQSIGAKKLAHDEQALLIFLSRLEEGKRISINKIEEHFSKTLDEYRYPDTCELPPWFTKALHGREELIAFLSGREEAKCYGAFYSDAEFFQVARLQERHVVLDGSNVAYNSVAGKDRVPHVANILKVVQFLKEKGFEQVSVISDAALKHRLSDRELLPELESATKYIEAPAEKSADQFIIEYVRKHNCLLVSNDTFREWKIKDPWVANNIDYYRLTFLIKDGTVLMPDLAA